MIRGKEWRELGVNGMRFGRKSNEEERSVLFLRRISYQVRIGRWEGTLGQTGVKLQAPVLLFSITIVLLSSPV